MPSASIQNLHDLFEHELKDIYDAESNLVEALRKQAAESTDGTIRSAFQAHQRETEQQKKRLEKVFDIWGREPARGEGCAGMAGLIEEHKNFKEHDPKPEILDLFNLTSAQKVERYEITAYESLANIAEQLGLDDAVELLMANLEEEEAMLEKMIALVEEDGRLARVPAGQRSK